MNVSGAAYNLLLAGLDIFSRVKAIYPSGEGLTGTVIRKVVEKDTKLSKLLPPGDEQRNAVCDDLAGLLRVIDDFSRSKVEARRALVASQNEAGDAVDNELADAPHEPGTEELQHTTVPLSERLLNVPLIKRFLGDPDFQQAFNFTSAAGVEFAKGFINKAIPVVEKAVNGDVEGAKADIASGLGLNPVTLGFVLRNIPGAEFLMQVLDVIVEGEGRDEGFNIENSLAPLRSFLAGDTPQSPEAAKAWFKELGDKLEGVWADIAPEPMQDRLSEMQKAYSAKIDNESPEEAAAKLRGGLNFAISAILRSEKGKMFLERFGVSEENIGGVAELCSNMLIANPDEPMVLSFGLFGLPPGTDLEALIHHAQQEEQSGNGANPQKVVRRVPQAQPANTEKVAGGIVGLIGAVISLGGLLWTGEKGKGLFSGIGALGLGGTIVSAIKRGMTEGQKALGWLDGKGAWIMGGVSALITAVPFFMSEHKGKTSLIGVGFGIIGGVLAWFFEPIRALFGLPTALNSKRQRTQGSEQINPIEQILGSVEDALRQMHGGLEGADNT